MSWENIHVDDYGWTGRLRMVQNGVAVDVSSFTTLKYVLRSPAGIVVEKTASFDTDGINGWLKYIFLVGEIDEIGEWSVEARLTKTGSQLTSARVYFEAHRRAEDIS